METFNYAKYLESKRTVDDRAINHRVWNRFISCLEYLAETTPVLHILEIGGGTGHTLFNLLESMGSCSLDYLVVDTERQNLMALKNKLLKWVELNGDYSVEEKNGSLYINTSSHKVIIRLVESDIVDYVQSTEEYLKYDAIIAQAVLDLLEIDVIMPLLKKNLKEDGLYYFPINFDGMTSFLPVYNADLDKLVEKIYHTSMVKSNIDRSQTGRRILMYLLKSKSTIVEVGGSDWVIVPNEDGKYPGEEHYFLLQILHFVRNELINSSLIDNNTAEKWYGHRVRQADEGRLVYMAHQLDVLASKQRS